jgi:hypothetical protein
MTSLRKVVVPLFVGLLAVGLGAEGASPAPPNTGTATTVISLPRLTLTMPDGSQVGIDLGSLSSAAATVSDPLASLGLGSASAAGNPLSAWQVDTSGGDQSADHVIPLSAASVSGSLDLVHYAVSAAPGTASSALQALTASLSAGGLATGVGFGQHGIASVVDAKHSTSDLELTTSGLSLRLGDILPSQAIAGLPLSTLVSLVQGLGLPLPSGASGVAAALANITTLLQQATTDATQLTQAQQSLAALVASLPSTAAAQQQLDQAQQQLTLATAAVDSATTQLAADTAAEQTVQSQVATSSAAVVSAQQQLTAATQALNSLLSQLPPALPAQILAAQAAAAQAQSDLATAQAAAASLQTQLAAAQSTVTADQQVVAIAQQQAATSQAAVASAQAALDALVQSLLSGNTALAAAQSAVATLTAAVQSVLGQLSTAVSALPDLGALRQALLGSVTGFPLVALGSTGVIISAAADDNGGAASVACTISGLSVGAEALPGGPCDQVVGSLGQAAVALQSLLGQLPLATSAPLPQLDGLVPASAGSTPTSTDTVTNATAGLAPLHLSLPQLTLAAVTDQSVARVQNALTAASQALAGLGLPAITGPSAPVLSALTALTSALPTGSTLGGLRTLGLDTSLAGVQSAVAHNRSLRAVTLSGSVPLPVLAAPAAPGSADPATPLVVTPADPSSPPVTERHPVADPAPAPRGLPFTGTESAIEVAVALLLLLAGAHLCLSRRRAAFELAP